MFNFFFYRLCLFLFFLGSLHSIFSQDVELSQFILCLDGGGSKTRVNVLDREGKLHKLSFRGQSQETLILPGMNINASSQSTVQKCLQELFEEAFLVNKRLRLMDIADKMSVFAGIAGAKSPVNHNFFLKQFSHFGIKPKRISVKSDAAMYVDLLPDEGAVLIAGTGSVCIGKKRGNIFYRGGLGKYLGDEGSGYYLASQAFKAALEYEGGWGEKTTLLQKFCEKLEVNRLSDLIAPFYNGTLSTSQLASLSNIVIRCAFDGDPVAKGIINRGAMHLAKILDATVENINSDQFPVLLIGGMFCQENAHYLDLVRLNVKSKKTLIYSNLSSQNVALMVVQDLLLLLNSAAPNKELPYISKPCFETFQKEFNLKKLTTEELHPETYDLSQNFQHNRLAALQTLNKVDRDAICACKPFQGQFQELVENMKTCISSKGRIFLVGAGSSGRVAVDLSCKWQEFWKKSPRHRQVIGVIAGGGRAFVRAKEGFEDSIQSGDEALSSYSLSSKDLVIFISASASAKFNIGAIHASERAGAKSYYFYNSHHIPKRTQELLDKKKRKVSVSQAALKPLQVQLVCRRQL